jgi:hypothetical protein
MSGQIVLAVADVVDYLKITGRFAPALRAVVERKVVSQEAKKRGIRISVKELQRTADVFRMTHDLNRAKDMNAWLKSNGLTPEAFEDYLETNLLVGKFKDRLMGKAKVKKYLASPVVIASVREMVYHDWIAAAMK